jgi:hypothetical protein
VQGAVVTAGRLTHSDDLVSNESNGGLPTHNEILYECIASLTLFLSNKLFGYCQFSTVGSDRDHNQIVPLLLSMGRYTSLVVAGLLGIAIGYYTFDQPLRVSLTSSLSTAPTALTLLLLPVLLLSTRLMPPLCTL